MVTGSLSIPELHSVELRAGFISKVGGYTSSQNSPVYNITQSVTY